MTECELTPLALAQWPYMQLLGIQEDIACQAMNASS